MKIVFDEAGNTGCLLMHKDVLNFKTQPVFTLGAVLTINKKDEDELIKRYSAFLARHGVNGEIKGSTLMKRENNALLYDFIENILDSTHFSLNLYDKRFYLSSLLCTAILGHEFQVQFINKFYSEVSELTFEDDDFFIRYCEFAEAVNLNTLHDFLAFLRDYDYKFLKNTEAVLLKMVNKILDEGGEENWLDYFMTYGWYRNKKKTNVVNLVALGELIDALKRENLNLRNCDITYIHDKSPEFETIFSSELSDLGIVVKFEDSKENILLQIADNAVSVLQKVYIETKKAFAAKKEWLPETEWLLTLTSSVLRRLTIASIKFTIPIPDWAMMLCVRDMFAPEFPKEHRKNLFFNPMYCEWQARIAYEQYEAAKRATMKNDLLADMRR